MSTDNKHLKEEFDRKKWREEREAQLRRIMRPINANGGTENCGHVALRLNQYLSNLSTLLLKPEPELHLESVPTTNANLVFQDGYLMDMEANTEKLKCNDASYRTIAGALSLLPRGPENRVYGFLITTWTIQGQIQGHISNFLVDEHDEVYFLDAQTLDAQTDPVYIGKAPLPGFNDDLYYMSSLAKSRMHLNPSSTILPKIKKELLDGEGGIVLRESDLNDIQVYKLYQEKIAKRTLSTAEFECIAKLALNEQSPAEMNNLGAQVLYGYCSQVGLHINQDVTRAVEYYKKAAKQHYAPAQTCFGFCYMRGIGVARDLKLAREWFEKAAQQNYATAQYNLGFFYQDGIGGARDLKLAVEWFERAARQNYSLAIQAFEKFRNALNIEQSNEKLKKDAHNKLLQSQIKRLREKRSFSEIVNDNTAAAATPAVAIVTAATTSNSTTVAGSPLKRARH